MKKTTKDKLIIILCFLSLSLISASLIRAQSPTDSAEDEEIPESVDPTTTESLKNRVNNYEEVLGDEDQPDSQKRGFIGVVQRVSEEALTIQNNKGTQIIPISERVQLTKDGESIALSDIAIDDQTIVMGRQVDDDFLPIKIIVTEDELFPKPQLVMIGSIASIQTDSITVLSRENQQEIDVSLNTETEYQDSDGDIIAKTDLFEALQVIVVGYVEVDEQEDTAEDSTSESETKNALVVKSLAPLE